MEMIAPDWERKEPPLVTRLRQQTCLTAALSQLDEALDLLGTGAGEELVVFPLGRCLTELAELTGRGDLDEVYDRIFSSFCIGK